MYHSLRQVHPGLFSVPVSEVHDSHHEASVRPLDYQLFRRGYMREKNEHLEKPYVNIAYPTVDEHPIHLILSSGEPWRGLGSRSER